MRGLSYKLKGFPGGNPFQESQARTYADDRVVAEFSPTPFFWSLFNAQHEVLLGTRGVGKTILLRMLTYSCLRQCNHPTAREQVDAKQFIGFYVPFHLEQITALPEKVTENEKLLYFHVASNCIAAKALLAQVAALLLDIDSDPRARLVREAQIVESISPMWFPDRAREIGNLRDLEWHIDTLFSAIDVMDARMLSDAGRFSSHFMAPIVRILPRLTDDLGLGRNTINWLACLDEAEFLPDLFLRSINTFLRSEKRPLVVKMATLPSKHSTLNTLADGISIQAMGNDFNYRIIDMEWESQDFTRLCDHIFRVRLSRCGLNDAELSSPDLTLEQFLGVIGKDDLIDYFKAELPDESTVDDILKGIREAISPKRREHLDTLRKDQAQGKAYLNKFSPVYFMRRMRAEDAKGSRVVGWFAGAKMIRRISDGNPRRFIQIMNGLVDQARLGELDPKDQHRVIKDVCKTLCEESEGLKEFGLVLRRFLDVVGNQLYKHIHGRQMVWAGCTFRIDPRLEETFPAIIPALKLGLDFVHIRLDPDAIPHGVSAECEFRLSYIWAVKYWLPMRHGYPFLVKSGRPQGSLLAERVPVTPKEANRAVKVMQLCLIGEENV